MIKSVNNVIIGIQINASQKDDELNIMNAMPHICSPIGKVGQTYNLFIFQQTSALQKDL